MMHIISALSTNQKTKFWDVWTFWTIFIRYSVSNLSCSFQLDLRRDSAQMSSGMKLRVLFKKLQSVLVALGLLTMEMARFTVPRLISKLWMRSDVSTNAVLFNAISNNLSASTFNIKRKELLKNKHILKKSDKMKLIRKSQLANFLRKMN